MRRKAASSAALAIVVSLVVGATAVGGWFAVNSGSGAKPAGTSVTTLTLPTGSSGSSLTQTLSSSYANGTVTLTITEVSTTTVTETVTSTVALTTVTHTVYENATSSAVTTVTSSSSPQGQGVTIGPVYVPASAFSTTPGNSDFFCTTSGTGGAAAYFQIQNSSPVGLNVDSVVINWEGQNNTFTQSSAHQFDGGICSMGPEGYSSSNITLVFTNGATLGEPAVQGQPFECVVSFSNGIVYEFSAIWQ